MCESCASHTDGMRSSILGFVWDCHPSICPPSQFRALTPLRAITLRAALRRSFLINISTYLSSRARADGKSICIHTSLQFHRPAVLQSMLHIHILLTESFVEKRREAPHCGWTVGRTGDLDGKNTQGQVGNKRKTFIVLCQQKFTEGKILKS